MSGNRDSLELIFTTGPHPIAGGVIEIVDPTRMPIPPVLEWSRPEQDADEGKGRGTFAKVQNDKDNAITIPACGANERLAVVLGPPGRLVGEDGTVTKPPTSISWQIQVRLDSRLVLRQERRTMEVPWDGLWEREIEWRRLSEGRMLEIGRFRFNGQEPTKFTSLAGDQVGRLAANGFNNHFLGTLLAPLAHRRFSGQDRLFKGSRCWKLAQSMVEMERRITVRRPGLLPRRLMRRHWYVNKGKQI